jgi:hypothetical protein
MQQIPKPDKFEERLLMMLEKLQDIKSVYSSMSKGDTGGFEF